MDGQSRVHSRSSSGRCGLRRAHRGLAVFVAIAILGSLLGALLASRAMASTAAQTPRVSASASRAAHTPPETLAQAPKGLQAAVRASLGGAAGLASSGLQQAKLSASDAAAGDQAGWSVAVSGSVAVVGAAYKNGSTGAAYVFVLSGKIWSQQAKLTASDAAPGDLFGGAVAVSGTVAVVAAPFENSYAGAAYVFVRSGTTWSQQAKLTTSDAGSAFFGFSVAVSGSIAVVGDYAENLQTGAAYVFVRSGKTWPQQAKLTASDAASGDVFGYAVAVSGSTVVVGAPYKNSFTGAAYVFVATGTTWPQQAKLIASDAAAGDQFGYSVAVSGSIAVVGAALKNSNTGAAYVFASSGTAWPQQAELTASDAAPGDVFGWSVAVSGSTAVVGAQYHSNTGAAYAFARSGTSWPQQAKLIASDGASGDGFGYSVAVSGSTAVVGAPNNNSAAGAAYVFVLPSQQAKLTASDAATNDTFGLSVAVSGSTALVGAPYRNSRTGAAYVFVRSGKSWSQQAELIASDAAANDYFGYSVAVSGSIAVVGAYGKNSATGAAYVFVQSGTTWPQQAELTASDAATFNYFGGTVAISGTTVLVGAWGNNSATGAAYVFAQSGTSWPQQARLTALDAAAGDGFGDSVAISGTYALVGAPNKVSHTGAAYVFLRSVTTWSQQTKLTASDGAANDYFGGYSLSISGSSAVVGAYGKNSSTGAAYVFVRSGTTWPQRGKLTASDGAAGDYFGKSVAISGSRVVVGAYLKNTDTGAAYVFVPSGGTWSQEAKLIASDTVQYDEFGDYVAISGTTAVVGAQFNPGTTTYPGAAYVFALP